MHRSFHPRPSRSTPAGPDVFRVRAQPRSRLRATLARAGILALAGAVLVPGTLPRLSPDESGSAQSAVPVAHAAGGYVDVDAGRYGWALPAIQDLRARGLMVGVDATHFAPGQTLTRAQLSTLFSRLKNEPLDGIGPGYTDVKPSDWHFVYVKAASANGLLMGVGGGRFAPPAGVTRAMTSVVAARSLGLDRVAQDLARAPLPYSDAAQVPAWARGAVSVAHALGVMRGDAHGFRPQDTVTRAEAAVIVERLLKVPDSATAKQGNRAVSYLSVEAGTADLNVGGSTTVRAWGHDAGTYLIPSSVTWSADHGTVTPTGRFTASARGRATVTARVPGTSVTKTVSVMVHQPAKLVFGDGTPPIALVNTSFPVAVAVAEADGRADPADSARPITLTLRAPDGTTSTLTANDKGGWATFQVKLAQEGAYTLTASTGGLPGASQSITAVASPVGTLQMTVAGQAASGGPIGLLASSADAVSVTIAGPDGQPRGERFPVHLDVTSGAGLVSPTSPSTLVTGAGPAGNLTIRSPGQASVQASVPGGAIAPATASLVIRSRGTLQVAAASGSLAAGGSTTVTASLLDANGQPIAADGVTVTLTPENPHGYDMPALTAQTRGGVASFTYTLTVSGAWGFRADAPGYATGESKGAVNVAAGEATQLAVHPAPSTLLSPGQTANVVVELADAYGNPVRAPFQLAVSPAAGAASAGALTTVQASNPGPGTAATFTAGSSGSRTYTFSSPDHPGLAPVRVTFRVLAQPSDVAAGKGLWLLFGDWKANGDEAIVQKALDGGYTHLYLEVATSRDGGFYGQRALDRLLSMAHNAGLALIAWVYPDLRNPAADTAWSQQVIAFRTPDGETADAFAPDIEEVMTPSTVAAYAEAMDQALGPDGRMIAITYPPQARPDYPFKDLVPYTDVFAPMSYWHHFVREYTYADAYRYVADSVTKLRALAGANVPVSVIGQTYDMFASGARGVYSPTALELQAAIDAARATNAIGFSFYRWGTATDEEWQAMDHIQYE